MRIEVIDDKILSLTERLGILKDFSFYLAGGTGLALQIGHRKSFDMDFFTSQNFFPEELSSLLRIKGFSVEGEIRSALTLHCILDDVKATFIYYSEPLLFPVIPFNSIEVADWRDIVIEKIRTIADRGQKKDFYDFYSGVRILGIEETVELIHKKFSEKVNYLHLLKGLVYFEDAERSPEPVLLGDAPPWDEVKNFFIKNISSFERAFLRFRG
ncbi:MAG: nucleotidyl transferase AbiEii/AbiGii toxin family protein [Thermodesulfovibrionales bacterium]|nr:nucleotidyl transferase AbiEii/AbiGii toxin family protein [Thermodesulfovibrionales bacterium]